MSAIIAAMLTVGFGGVAVAAGTFRPAKKTIVLNTSIADVKVAEKATVAKRAWGVKLACTGSNVSGYCAWKDTAAHDKASATFSWEGKKVYSVVLYAGQIAGPNGRSIGYSYKGPLMRVKTKSGLGLGSSYADVHSKAPGGEIAYWSDGTSPMYYILKRGKVTTTFSFSDIDERAHSIQISNLNSSSGG